MFILVLMEERHEYRSVIQIGQVRIHGARAAVPGFCVIENYQRRLEIWPWVGRHSQKRRDEKLDCRQHDAMETLFVT